MRFRLADTLDYVFSQVGDTIAVRPADARQLTGSIRATKQSPHVFGAYYDLVFAIEGDDIGGARKLAAELFEHSTSNGTTITRIDERCTIIGGKR